MRKYFVILLSCVWLAACAGNPPAWWNPTGRSYEQKEKQKTSRPVSTSTYQPRPTEELDISLQDETYEEMTLTPLQDEEGENESGDSSAQSIVPAEDEFFLPPPSILEE